MDRLTQYFEVGAYTEKQNIIDVSDKLPLFENGVIMGKAIDRLAEFEDFMEENECDCIEEMKSALNQCEQKYFKMQRDYEELKHCIWKDTPIEQIRNNYERSHNFDFVGVAYNRGKAKIDRKVRQENQTLKDRWEKLREYIEENMEDDNNPEEEWCVLHRVSNKMQELESEEN